MANPTKLYLTNLGIQQPSASDLTDGTTGTGTVALSASPVLTGTPTAPTQAATDNSTDLATTAFAQAMAGGVNTQTASYAALAADKGKVISMNGSSLTLTLPASPPTTKWWIAVENINVSSLTVSRNGLNIDGAASNLTLAQNQGVLIFTDGINYFTSRGMGSGGGGSVTLETNGTPNGSQTLLNLIAGSNITIVDNGSGGVTFTAGASTANAGGVNSQTANYAQVAGDSGKLITMNGSNLTLTLNATPVSTEWIAVENTNSTSLTISRNGLNIDGAAVNIILPQNQGILLFSDGVNWFTMRGISPANKAAFPLTIVQQTPFESGGTNVTSFTVTFPNTTAASGNTLFIILSCDGNASFAIPSGWTVDFDQQQNTYARLVLLHKTSAGDTSVTFTSVGGDSFSGFFMEVSGVHALDQVSSGGVANQQSLQLPTITPAAGAAVFGAIAYVSNSSGPQIYPAILIPTWAISGVSADQAVNGRGLIAEVYSSASSGVAIAPSFLYFPNLSLFSSGGLAYATFSIL